MNFKQFQQTRRPVADLGKEMNAEYFDKSPRAGFMYDGDCYIEKEDDGTFYLILHRDEWTSANLEELEAILYAWCLTECPDGMGMEVDDNMHVFICKLQQWMGLEKFANAMLANAKTIPGVCHMHDHCDANAAALFAVHDDIDAAAELYDRARVYLRGGAV
jgi:hypothetical protein